MPPLPANSLKLRHATTNDLDFITATARALFLEYGSYDRYLREWFSDQHVATRIGVVDDAFAGFYMLANYRETELQVAELLAIAVDATFQNRGIGKALLDDALAHALDATEVRLSVASGNARAERLFASRGFRLKDAVGVYPSGQRALSMVKRAAVGGRMIEPKKRSN